MINVVRGELLYELCRVIDGSGRISVVEGWSVRMVAENSKEKQGRVG
jgi:hypothetical protein